MNARKLLDTPTATLRAMFATESRRAMWARTLPEFRRAERLALRIRAALYSRGVTP